MTWLDLTVWTLACFRLAVLLSEDSGPSKMFLRFRQMLKREAKQHPTLRKTDLHHGVECLRCSSVWIAAPVAAFAWFRKSLSESWMLAGDLFLLWMAISAAAILWNRAFPKR